VTPDLCAKAVVILPPTFRLLQSLKASLASCCGTTGPGGIRSRGRPCLWRRKANDHAKLAARSAEVHRKPSAGGINAMATRSVASQSILNRVAPTCGRCRMGGGFNSTGSALGPTQPAVQRKSHRGAPRGRKTFPEEASTAILGLQPSRLVLSITFTVDGPRRWWHNRLSKLDSRPAAGYATTTAWIGEFVSSEELMPRYITFSRLERAAEVAEQHPGAVAAVSEMLDLFAARELHDAFWRYAGSGRESVPSWPVLWSQ